MLADPVGRWALNVRPFPAWYLGGPHTRIAHVIKIIEANDTITWRAVTYEPSRKKEFLLLDDAKCWAEKVTIKQQRRELRKSWDTFLASRYTGLEK